MFAYCCNNPILGIDSDGCFVLSTLGSIFLKVAVGSLVNIATSALAAWATGQDFGWIDVGMAILDSALGFIPTVGGVASFLWSSGSTAYSAVANGAGYGEAFLRGIGAGVGSIFNIGSMAKFYDDLSLGVSAFCDLIFSAGESMMSAGVTILLDKQHEAPEASGNKQPQTADPPQKPQNQTSPHYSIVPYNWKFRTIEIN